MNPRESGFSFEFWQTSEAKASGLLTPGLRSAKVVPPHHPSIGRRGLKGDTHILNPRESDFPLEFWQTSRGESEWFVNSRTTLRESSATTSSIIGRAGRRSGPGRAKRFIGSGVPREGIPRLRSGLGLSISLSEYLRGGGFC